MKRLLLIVVAASVVLSACGGGEGGEEATTSIENLPEASQPGSAESEPTSTEVPTEETPASGKVGTGSATIGDIAWEFGLIEGDGRSACMLDGIVLISMFGTDDSGREIALTINGAAGGGEAAVTAGDATIQGDRWIADSSVYANLSGIEGMPDGVGAMVQVDGNSVSGTGVFYEDRRLNEVRPTGDPYDAGVVDGTFEATCPAN